MVESPILIIIRMIFLIVQHTVNTLAGLYQLFLELLSSLEFITGIGGALGLVVSIIIVTFVVFFLGKFVFGMGKNVVILLIVGITLLLIFIFGLTYIA